ncbi:MAG: hypothetical protein KA020_13995, partial [Planctomycetes bacterium]|nr:hypothetical protein [Planctomycetota bacterium]
GEHGAHGAHDAHDAHGAEDAHAEPPTNNAAPSAWTDPIVLVGISGVASLLLAALVAVLKK